MMKFALYLLGALALLNALIMWFAPMTWYEAVPGVAMMGPFNIHFIRDIALVFAFSGGALAWGAWKGAGLVALCGATWPVLHAIFHIQIWVARGLPFDDVAFVNLAGIQLPAWAGLYFAWRLYQQTKKG